MGFPVVQAVKGLPAMQKTRVRSLGWEDLLEKGMAKTLQYFMDRGAWWAIVHGVAKESDMTK